MAMKETLAHPEPVLGSPGPTQEFLDELVEFITARVGIPSDVMAVAALLETYGISDLDAQQKYKQDDVFTLADVVYTQCLQRAAAETIPNNGLAQQSFSQSARNVTKGFFQAASYNGSFLVQIVALLALGYNLGYYTRFAPREVSIIFVAVILSFIISGGFTRAIGYAASFYLGQKNYFLASKMLLRLVVLALIITGISVVIEYQVASSVVGLPMSETLTLIFYTLLFSGLLLLSAVMYGLQQRLGLFVMSLGGVAVVIVVMEGTNWGIYAAHWFGMFAASVIAGMWAIGFLRVKMRQPDAKTGGDLPRIRQQIIATAPHFIYGTLYYFFYMLSRILAYVDVTGNHVTFSVRVPFEAGLIWSLFAFLFLTPLLESIAAKLFQDLARKQNRTRLRLQRGTRRRNSAFKLYGALLAVLMIATVIVSIAVYAGVLELRKLHVELIQDAFFEDENITDLIFFWSSVVNVLLLWALLNISLLMSSRKLWLPIKATTTAIIITVFFGVIFRHVAGYEYSILSSVIGAACLVAITCRGVWRILRTVDYHEYSSYWLYSM